jgi:hypothetical protein
MLPSTTSTTSTSSTVAAVGTSSTVPARLDGVGAPPSHPNLVAPIAVAVVAGSVAVGLGIRSRPGRDEGDN